MIHTLQLPHLKLCSCFAFTAMSSFVSLQYFLLKVMQITFPSPFHLSLCVYMGNSETYPNLSIFEPVVAQAFMACTQTPP